MSSTLLEATRASHEEVERLERLVVKDLQNEPPSTRDRLYQSHRVRNMVEQIIETTHKIVGFFFFFLAAFVRCFSNSRRLISCECDFFLLFLVDRLRFTRIRTMQGRMRLLRLVDRVRRRRMLMCSVHFMIG